MYGTTWHAGLCLYIQGGTVGIQTKERGATPNSENIFTPLGCQQLICSKLVNPLLLLPPIPTSSNFDKMDGRGKCLIKLSDQ